ncbi:flagellar basal body FlgE domain-containing protein [Entomospira culicis]|nr:flagellar basal body FlgE domain-containing protein [Entomospira culicis]WDI36720.1 flagellar basal body FlgE domain-containing protein [Entomospira culicis]
MDKKSRWLWLLFLGMLMNGLVAQESLSEEESLPFDVEGQASDTREEDGVSFTMESEEPSDTTENPTARRRERMIIPKFKPTTQVNVVGGNLPKLPLSAAYKVSYVGQIIDAVGEKRAFTLEFQQDQEEFNRWLVMISIEGVDKNNVDVAVQSPEMRQMESEHHQLWLDFNNDGQLARLMDMSGMVIDEEDALVYVRYTIGEDEAQFNLNFGKFITRGNFITQFKGQASVILVSDGYSAVKRVS